MEEDVQKQARKEGNEWMDRSMNEWKETEERGWIKKKSRKEAKNYQTVQ